MSENKEHSTIKEKGPSDIGYHGNQGNASDPQNDDIKQQAGELLKAAGGLAGSLGKLAKKKGVQIKEKLEDEEFQEKISSGIKAVTDKIDDYVTADPTTEKPEVVKVSTDTVTVQRAEVAAKNEAENNSEIRTTFEVEGRDSVNFETVSPKKGISKFLEQRKEERERVRAEEERIRQENERKERERNKKSWLFLGIMMAACIAVMGFMYATEGSRHEGEIHPPISSDELTGLNYEDVAKEFEDAGFTNVKTMKKEDLVIGWLSSDGEVEKVTIADSEEFSTTYWYSPDDKVVIYYHTFPEDVETAEKVQEEADKSLEEDADLELLESFIGMSCTEADPKIKEAGYTPIYLAANTRDDMTESIENDDYLAESFKISEVDGVVDKSVYYIVKSDEMLKQEKHASEIESKMKDHHAMSIVQLYGETQLIDFDLKYITCEARVSGNGWDIYGQCTYKDAYGNKYKGECVAHVNADTEEVEAFEVR